jgi:Kef-type K+ transport system membrane component KefB
LFLPSPAFLHEGLSIGITFAATHTNIAVPASLSHPFARFLLQLLVILIVTRIAGWLLRKLGQPAVIGEIAAGILLGPSLIGAVWPEFSQAIFPKESLDTLGIVSEMGLVLFMLVIGVELDAAVVRKKAKQSLIISGVSIVLPFASGILLAFALYRNYAAAGSGFMGFALFMGIAMSITAFPVLARILRERGLENSRLGLIALSCAAADDVAAWCILAAITAVIKAQDISGFGLTIGLCIAYVLVMLLIVRPLVRRLILRKAPDGGAPRYLIPALLGGMLASAWVAQVIGIHSLFGAFLFGLMIPVDWAYRRAFVARMEDVAGVLLLPVFFVITGLRTQIGALHGWQDWSVCLLIIVAAVAGKLGGGALAARATGEKWKDAFALGALMNTRGLMQLIVLNIGYDLGILSPAIFSMMVIMAIVTTAMTAPVMKWVE